MSNFVPIGSTQLDPRVLAAEEPEPNIRSGNSFTQGASQGSKETTSQLRALLARGAQTVGADDFAKDQYAKSAAEQQQAQALAPEIDDWHKVNSLGTAGSYVAGQAGRMIPALAATIVGGTAATLLAPEAAGAGLIGATVANAPLTTGEAIQSQENNPNLKNASLLDKNLTAAGQGIASSAVQNVVPVALGGKLIGKGVANVAKTKLGALAENLGEGVVGNAAAGGVSEGINQAAASHLDPNRDTSKDTEQMQDAAIGGGIMGVPFAGLGMAGHMLHGENPAAKTSTDGTPLDGTSLDGGTTPIPPSGGGFMGAVGRAFKVEKANSKAPVDLTPHEKIDTLFDKPSDDLVTAARQAALGQEPTPPVGVEATPKTLADADNKADTNLVNATYQAALDPNVSPELKQMYGVLDVQGRMALQKPEFRQRLGELLMDYHADQMSLDDANAAIQQLGYEGKESTDPAVASARNAALAPVLERNIPGFTDRTDETRTTMADAIMRIARRASDGETLPDSLTDYLNKITDGKGAALISTLASKAFDGEARENVFKAASKMTADDVKRTGLENTVQGALPDDIRSNYSRQDITDLTNRIRDLIGENATKNMGKAEADVYKQRLDAKMQETFGDKYDSVVEAFAQDAKDKSAQSGITPPDRTDTTRAASDTQKAEHGVLSDEEGDPNDKLPTHDKDGNPINYSDKPIYYGNSKKEGNPLVRSDEAHQLYYPSDAEGPQTRLMKKAEADHPDRAVNWMPAKEYALEHGISKDKLHEMTGGKPDDYGVVVAERTKDETRLAPEDVEQMKVGSYKRKLVDGEWREVREKGKTSHYGNDTTFTFKVGEKVMAFDASRVASYMARKEGKGLAHTEGDEKAGSLYRTARAFIEGVAALSDHYGTRIDPSDSTVVVNRGKNQITYGELKQIYSDGEMSSKTRELLEPLREKRDALIGQRAAMKDAKTPQADIDAKSKEIAAAHKELRTETTKARLEGKKALINQRADLAKIADGITDPAQKERIQSRISELDGRIGTDDLFARRDKIVSMMDEKNSEPRQTFLEQQLKIIDKRIGDANMGEYIEHEGTSKFQDTKAKDGISEIAPESNIHMVVADHGEEGAARKVDFSGAALDYNRSTTKPLSKEVKEWNRTMTEPDNAAVLIKKIGSMGDAGKLAQVTFNLGKDKSLKGNPEAAKILDAANKRIGDLIKQDDSTAYDLMTHKDGKNSDMKQGTGKVTSQDRKEVYDYIKKVLGDAVQHMWSKSLGAAGMFTKEGFNKSGKPLIELSVHALNPMTVAYHEAMHAFVNHVMENGLPEVRDSLLKAANSPVVMGQLRKLLKDEPEALKAMLNDPEERIAYMHQFYAAGELKMGDSAKSIFGKMTDLIRNMMGIWSNDKRAEHIMNYFQTGEYAKNMGDRNAVSRALLGEGTNKMVSRVMNGEAAKAFGKLGSAVLGVGAQRLRDTNIPAIQKIADLVRSRSTDARSDAGYITASGTERRQRVNDMVNRFGDVDHKIIQSAFEKMQQGVKGNAIENQIMKHLRDVLKETRDYMVGAGVDVGNRGNDYMPQMWDLAKVASKQSDVLEMLEKYKDHKDMPGTPKEVLAMLMRNEGSELDASLRTDMTPAMQSAKRRVLYFIDTADKAPFLENDAYKVMNSYISQATKRAEWSRRFGDNNEKLRALREQAIEEGATPEHLDVLDRYMGGITGTLGSDVSPNWRKWQANAMVYQNIRLLPMGVFSALIDPIGIMVNGGTMRDAGGAFMQGIKDIPRGFKEMPISDARYKFAEDIGTIESAVLQHRLGASFGGMNTASGFMRKANEMMFKYNLMEQFNTSMRVAATEASMKFLARNAEGKSDFSVRRLQELGLTSKDIVVKDGRPLTSVKEFMDHGYSEARARDASTKMALAVNKWVDGAVLRPDASQKAIWMNDPHYALIAHMKQFSFAFQETILKRVAHEAQHGNYQALASLGAYIPVMMAADMAKGLIQGAGSQPSWKQDWDIGDWLESSIQRAGLFGVGQFGIDVAKSVRQQGTGFGAAFGPTAGQLGDMVSLAGGHGEFAHTLVEAMPANSLWSGWMGGAHSGGSSAPIEPISE